MTSMGAQTEQMDNTMAGPGALNRSPAGATQSISPEPLAIKTDGESYYGVMAGQRQLPAQQQQHQQHQQPFYTNQISAITQQPQFQSPNMGSAVWPSPRSSVDEFDNYSYRGQAPTSYHPASLSPRTWPSSVQTPPPAQFEVPFHHQEAYEGLPSDHMTMSPEDLRGASLNISVEYGTGCYQQQDAAPKYESPPQISTSVSPYATSPVSMQEAYKADMNASPATTSPPPAPQRSLTAESKGESEPYAQLIWKALRSQENHCMTLQQLYQWFIDNTDKPEKAGSGGWRNSVRHNLSMNEAFARKPLPVDQFNGGNNNSSSDKRPSEWYLVEKYRDRVMPTTHFRGSPRDSSRRSSSIPHPRPRHAAASAVSRTTTYHPSPEFPNRTMPGRAMSGSRGGRATTRSRNAARNLRLQTENAAALAASHHHHQQQQQQHHQGWSAPPQRTMNPEHLDAYFRMPYGPADSSRARFDDRRDALPLSIRSAGPPPHQAAYPFGNYNMADVAGVYNPQQPQHQHQTPQHQHQQPQTENVLYGWGNSTNHGL
ncbi:Forkhead box protein J3 [Colletotrichum trifolii]|uniref:Forkhead box protein J3 n=1 Tax=Colletotrichum trifolii TaxID=5466 RepID=A0A4V3HUI3_COLTR|nr:Forkhead box protein J3 [Colletotrichum trifolii]